MQSFRLFFNHPNPVPNEAHARAMTQCCKQTVTMLVSSLGRSLKNHQAMLEIENTPLFHSSKAFETKLSKRQSWPYASTCYFHWLASGFHVGVVWVTLTSRRRQTGWGCYRTGTRSGWQGSSRRCCGGRTRGCGSSECRGQSSPAGGREGHP